jgi:nitrate reductase NapE component
MARRANSIVVRIGLVVAAAAVVLGCCLPYAYNPGDQSFGPMALVEMPIVAIATVGLAGLLLWRGAAGRAGGSFGFTIWCVGMFTLVAIATKADPSGAGQDPRLGRAWLLVGLAIGALLSGLQCNAARGRYVPIGDD